MSHSHGALGSDPLFGETVGLGSQLISVITPTHKPEAPYLEEAYEGLCAQDVNWEWVLQFDGERWDMPSYLLGDDRVRLECNGKHLGVAMTRNRACVRARGELVQVLDSDDVLLPGATRVLMEAVLRTGVAYAAGRVQH